MNKPIPLIINVKTKALVKEGRLFVKGTCLTGFKGSRERMDVSKVSVGTAEGSDFFDVSFTAVKGIPAPKGYSVNRFCFSADIEKILGLDVQTKVFVYYDEPEMDCAPGTIYYRAADRRTGRGRTSRVFFENGRSVFLRQTRKNTLYLTVRETDRYDKAEGRSLVKKHMRGRKNLVHPI